MKKRGESRISEARLRWEARLFSCYLTGEDIGREVEDRYIRFCQTWFLKDESRSEYRPVMRFLRRMPWTLGYLDAACGLAHPDHLLRRKLLGMAAILEATPDHTRHFLPDRRRNRWILAGICRAVLRAVTRMAGGILFIPLVRRRS